MPLSMSRFLPRSTSTLGSNFNGTPTIGSNGAPRTNGNMWSISSTNTTGGVGQALGSNFSRVNSGSTNTSQSTNSIDYDAKKATDAQLAQAMEYAKTLRGDTNNLQTDRLNALSAGFDQLQGMVGELGEYDRQRIDRDATSQRNSVAAQLAGRGLMASTVLPTLQQGVERNRLEAQGQLSESLRNQSIGTLLQRLTSMDSARADQITKDSELGQIIAELAARIGLNQPTKSTSTSTSRSASF